MKHQGHQGNLDDWHALEAVEASMKWYGWGSPIGLSIFLLTLTIMAAIIFTVFFK